MKRKTNELLTYDTQMEFKSYAARTLRLPRDLYYFDDVDCVDAGTSRDIRNVKCDGTITWGEAASRLREHFGIER